MEHLNSASGLYHQVRCSARMHREHFVVGNNRNIRDPSHISLGTILNRFLDVWGVSNMTCYLHVGVQNINLIGHDDMNNCRSRKFQ